MARLTLLLTGLILAVLIGCSDSTVTAPSSDASSPTADLPEKADQMVALYGATDEGALELDMADAVRLGLEHYLADTSYDVYAVTTVWGSFSTASTPPQNSTTVDWSGSMNVNGVGDMGVISVISFDNGQDSLIPTADPMTIAWRSLTTNDIDGLVTFIAMKRGIFYIQAPSFYFRSAPVSVEFAVDQLAHFQAFYPTGNLSGLAIYGRKLKPIHCPRGQISGQWVRADSTHMNGAFEAVWRSVGTNTGTVGEVGRLQGNFWTGDAQNLFAGVWMDANGVVTGNVQGTWMYTDYAMCPVCGTRYGVFEGEIFDLTGQSVGVLKGGFGEMTIATPTPPPLALSMAGVFRFKCPTSNDSDIAAD